MMSGSVKAWAARQDNNRVSKDEHRLPSPKQSPKAFGMKKVVGPSNVAAPAKVGFTSKLNTYHHTHMQSDGNSVSIHAPSNSRKGPVLDDTLTEDGDINDENSDTFKNRLQDEKMSIMMQLLDEDPR
jgi:hypothetical protein